MLTKKDGETGSMTARPEDDSVFDDFVERIAKARGIQMPQEPVNTSEEGTESSNVEKVQKVIEEIVTSVQSAQSAVESKSAEEEDLYAIKEEDLTTIGNSLNLRWLIKLIPNLPVDITKSYNSIKSKLFKIAAYLSSEPLLKEKSDYENIINLLIISVSVMERILNDYFNIHAPSLMAEEYPTLLETYNSILQPKLTPLIAKEPLSQAEACDFLIDYLRFLTDICVKSKISKVERINEHQPEG